MRAQDGRGELRDGQSLGSGQGVEVGAAARTRTTRREDGEAPMARRGCTAVPRSIALCALGAREAATDCITRVRRCVPLDRALRR